MIEEKIFLSVFVNYEYDLWISNIYYMIDVI